jgi:hypothetical protein
MFNVPFATRRFLSTTTRRSMSFAPLYTYVSPEQVAKLVKEMKPEEVQVVDVRDDDFQGN